MIQILHLGHEIMFLMVWGIYSLVAKVYDFMLDLAHVESINTSSFDDFTTTLYVLAGVFMLFKIIIGLLQMLINPDLVTDKQAGIGKMVTRVIMCLVMLMLFVPNGIIFGENGIFHRVEEALLAKDGLVTKLSGTAKEEKLSGISEKENKSKEGTATSLIENVYAASDKLSCYYYNESEWLKYTQGGDKEKISSNKFYKITFSLKRENKKYKKLKGGQVYYYVSTGEVGKGAYEKGFHYSSLPAGRELADGDQIFAQLNVGEGVATKLPSECPKVIDVPNNGDLLLKKTTHTMGVTGYTGGYTKITDMVEKVKGDYEQIEEINPSESKTYLKGIDDTAIKFAQGTASSLQECAAGHEKECTPAQKEMFRTSEANQEIVELMAGGYLDLGFIMSIITGLAITVYLVFLCIEILVRRLKLYFLEIISPIPVISYVDPKDKVFNQWFKMYLSTYLDLFIKLISVGIATTLLATLFNEDAFWKDGGVFAKFFEIVAILVFAKLLPTMISKIFGLDSMGGSFKDITGMAKRAAYVGGGAALTGGAHALATAGNTKAAYEQAKRQGKNRAWAVSKAIGAGALTSVGAVARGAGSGVKGEPLKGASSVLAAGRKKREAIASGSTAAGRVKSQLASILNIRDPYEKAVALRDVNQEYVNSAKAYEDESLNKVNKAIGKGRGNNFSSLLEARNDFAAVRNGEKVSRYSSDSSGRIVDKLTGNVIKNENGSTIMASSQTGRNMLNATADEYALTSAEAEARIKGEEKGAAATMRAVFESGDAVKLKQYGFELDSDDYKEMISLNSDANEAAKNAGYTAGYNGETKNKAKQAAKNYSADARRLQADHNAINH